MTFTEQYHRLLKTILTLGVLRNDPNRKGKRRKQVPFADITHDLREGFPAITTKPLYWKGVVVELLWFLKGDTNIKYLLDNNVHIWDKDARNHLIKRIAKRFPKKPNPIITNSQWKGKIDNFDTCQEYLKKDLNISDYRLGDLGRIYGAQWRKWHDNYDPAIMDIKGEWKTVDQISNLINTLRTNPLSSSMIVNSWNPAELGAMALPPCHYSFQVSCEPISIEVLAKNFEARGIMGMSFNEGDKYKQMQEFAINADMPIYYLDLQFNMRSSDVMLGLPFNIASYALLAHILAKMCNMVPRYVRYNGQNVHLYESHIDATEEQLKRCDVDRSPWKSFYKEPSLAIHSTNWMSWRAWDIDELLSEIDASDFELENYKHHPKLKNNTEMLAYE